MITKMDDYLDTLDDYYSVAYCNDLKENYRIPKNKKKVTKHEFELENDISCNIVNEF